MKISIVQGGGFAGLVSTTVADSESLAPEDADALRSKVEEAGLFELEPPAAAFRAEQPEQPDRPAYEVTIEDGDRRHSIVLDEGSLPDSVRSLISWVESVPGREERLSGPGGGRGRRPGR